MIFIITLRHIAQYSVTTLIIWPLSCLWDAWQPSHPKTIKTHQWRYFGLLCRCCHFRTHSFPGDWVLKLRADQFELCLQDQDESITDWSNMIFHLSLYHNAQYSVIMLINWPQSGLWGLMPHLIQKHSKLISEKIFGIYGGWVVWQFIKRLIRNE